MKNIKRVLLLVLCMYPTVQHAQLWDFILEDKGVVTRRGVQIGLLTSIIENRQDMLEAMPDLVKAEKEFHDKVTSHADLESLRLYAVMNNLNSKMKDEWWEIRDEIARIRALPLYWRHGILQIESDYKNEQKHAYRANQDLYKRILIGSQFSGGRGMFQTVFLKYLLQIRRVMNNFRKIRYRLDNRATINRAYVENK